MFYHTLFKFFLTAVWPAVGHSQGNSLTNLMLIIVFYSLTQRSPGASLQRQVPKSGQTSSGV